MKKRVSYLFTVHCETSTIYQYMVLTVKTYTVVYGTSTIYWYHIQYHILVLTPVLAHDRPREVSLWDALADVASRRVGAY